MSNAIHLTILFSGIRLYGYYTVSVSRSEYRNNGGDADFSTVIMYLSFHCAWVNDGCFFVIPPIQVLSASITKRHEFTFQGNMASWTYVVAGFSHPCGLKDHDFCNAHRSSVRGLAEQKFKVCFWKWKIQVLHCQFHFSASSSRTVRRDSMGLRKIWLIL